MQPMPFLQQQRFYARLLPSPSMITMVSICLSRDAPRSPESTPGCERLSPSVPVPLSLSESPSCSRGPLKCRSLPGLTMLQHDKSRQLPLPAYVC